MSIKALTSDLLICANAKGLRLTFDQAAGLAALNRRSVTATELSKSYWKQLTKIIRDYLKTQSTKDRVLGGFKML